MDFLKHVGFLNNTHKRILVVFHQIPGQNETALVVDMEALPPRFHDAVESLLKLPESQNSKDFYEVLSRRLMPDENRPFINCLHDRGYLQPAPIDNVVMTPRPNVTIPLRKLLELTNRDTSPSVETVEPNLADFGIDPDMVPNVNESDLALNTKEAAPDKFNSHVHNQAINATEHQMGIAKGLLMEAAMLEGEAAQKRKRAYLMVPTLDPSYIEAPAKSEAKKVAVKTPVAPQVKAKTGGKKSAA